MTLIYGGSFRDDVLTDVGIDVEIELGIDVEFGIDVELGIYVCLIVSLHYHLHPSPLKHLSVCPETPCTCPGSS